MHTRHTSADYPCPPALYLPPPPPLAPVPASIYMGLGTRVNGKAMNWLLTGSCVVSALLMMAFKEEVGWHAARTRSLQLWVGSRACEDAHLPKPCTCALRQCSEVLSM